MGCNTVYSGCVRQRFRDIFVNNQLDAQLFFMYVYFYILHVSVNNVPIIRRINCTNTTAEGLSGPINAGNFLTSCKVYWLASQEGLCSME